MNAKMTFTLFAALICSGCVPLAIAGGGEVATTVAQERSVGNAIDDAGIFTTLKYRYAQKESKDLFANVEVKVVEGRVLLTGNVDKSQTQIDAVNIAWGVEGVREVINEIQINDKSNFTNYSKDVWISSQIRTKLLITKNIRSINYSVVTVNQVVYLMGIAQDQTELNNVTNIASRVAGVKRVVSYVKLKDDPRRAGI